VWDKDVFLYPELCDSRTIFALDSKSACAVSPSHIWIFTNYPYAFNRNREVTVDVLTYDYNGAPDGTNLWH